jgi:modulator of FtsH protease HflC
VILAEAESKGQILRGEGDAIAAKTFADAYSKDPEFYGFYRSLQAYRDTFQGQNDLVVLDPDSEFFRYFKNDQGRPGG